MLPTVFTFWHCHLPTISCKEVSILDMALTVAGEVFGPSDRDTGWHNFGMQHIDILLSSWYKVNVDKNPLAVTFRMERKKIWQAAKKTGL